MQKSTTIIAMGDSTGGGKGGATALPDFESIK